MTHGDAVIHSNSIEFSCITAFFFNDCLHFLTDHVQMRMTGNELRK